MSYPSDLTDKQWARIEPFFGRSDPRGARSRYPKRRVVEAILYRLREGYRWRVLPQDFPPWDTVYDHWRRWQKRGVWPGSGGQGIREKPSPAPKRGCEAR